MARASRRLALIPSLTVGAVSVVVVALLGAAPPAPAPGQMSQSYTRLPGYQVMFTFTQNSKALARNSSDQITVMFSNRSAEGTRAPRPLFGDDIVQEFSFSGQDFEKDQLTFTRRVRDKSFLDAQYIRVVNHGSGGWGGDRISLTVDGETIFDNFPMSPRKGAESARGFQNFNPGNWATRSYWEEALQRHRRLPTAK